MSRAEELATAFCALSQPTHSPSTQSQNQWHFELRYWHIEPNPSHVLLILQHNSKIAHLERLPLGTPFNEPGYTFFPVTSRDAAPEVAKCLLHFFVNRNKTNSKNRPDTFCPCTPWKLTTAHKGLALAVGVELRRLGITPPSLQSIDITPHAVITQARKEASTEFRLSLLAAGYFGLTMLVSPEGAPPVIVFEDEKFAAGPYARGISQEMNERERCSELLTRYISQVENVTPASDQSYRGPVAIEWRRRMWSALVSTVGKWSESTVNSLADRGDINAALDYGIRLYIGLGCKRNVKRARLYFLKVISSERASQAAKAQAHSYLVFWYWESISPQDDTSQRYMYAVCHHANWAARISKSTSPPGAPPSPIVLDYCKTVLVPNLKVLPEDVEVFFEDIFCAMVEHNAYLKKAEQELTQRRERNLNRYRCAALDCEIEATSGYMLEQCAGSCDKDKKPSYCSQECQRADWPVHKPFCRPGAPSSVNKSDNLQGLVDKMPAREPGAGLLCIPIKYADGSSTVLSSTSLGADELRRQKQGLLDAGLMLHELTIIEKNM